MALWQFSLHHLSVTCLLIEWQFPGGPGPGTGVGFGAGGVGCVGTGAGVGPMGGIDPEQRSVSLPSTALQIFWAVSVTVASCSAEFVFL